jgi:choice-of-anchor C domain-containing protein
MRGFLCSVTSVTMLSFSILMTCQATAGSIVNGGFELPRVTNNNQFTTITPGSGPVGFGWTVISGSVDVTLGGGIYISAFAGSQFLDLDGSNTGAILQSFVTTPGASYELSFAYANNPVRGTVPASATVSVFNSNNSENLITPFTITHSTSSNGDPDWIVSLVQFVAQGDQTTLSFTSNDPFGSVGGIALDAVTVTVNAVPEPSSWVLAGVGFLIIGKICRRKIL